MSCLTKIKEFFTQDFKISQESNHKVSLAVAVGFLCAVLPIWGFQMATAIAIAGIMRLNKIVVLATSNISIPPLTPIWLYLSYITGCIITNTENNLSLENITIEEVSKNMLVYVVGAVIFAILLAAVGYALCFVLLLLFRKQQPNTSDNGKRQDA